MNVLSQSQVLKTEDDSSAQHMTVRGQGNQMIRIKIVKQSDVEPNIKSQILNISSKGDVLDATPNRMDQTELLQVPIPVAMSVDTPGVSQVTMSADDSALDAVTQEVLVQEPASTQEVEDMDMKLSIVETSQEHDPMVVGEQATVVKYETTLRGPDIDETGNVVTSDEYQYVYDESAPGQPQTHHIYVDESGNIIEPMPGEEIVVLDPNAPESQDIIQLAQQEVATSGVDVKHAPSQMRYMNHQMLKQQQQQQSSQGSYDDDNDADYDPAEDPDYDSDNERMRYSGVYFTADIADDVFAYCSFETVVLMCSGKTK